MNIGIVTISFNQERFLSECLDSVVLRPHSTHTLRHVIVDPGSRDGSREFITERAEKEPYRECIFEPDQGPSDGLNKGFQRLLKHSDVLGYINSDDRFTPDALDWVGDFFTNHPHIDCIMGGIRICDDHGRITRRCRVPLRYDPRLFVSNIGYFAQQGFFFRPRVFNAVGGFNLANRQSWDSEFALDATSAGFSIHPVPVILGDFRIYPGTITASSANGPGTTRVQLENERIRQKFLAQGVKPYPALSRHLLRLWHRLDPIRRWYECFPSYPGKV